MNVKVVGSNVAKIKAFKVLFRKATERNINYQDIVNIVLKEAELEDIFNIDEKDFKEARYANNL